MEPSTGSPPTARHACEICRERKVRCDRTLPKCRRCDRLNQTCVYSAVSNRRPRDGQIKELQARLAKTEAQLALNTPQSIPDMSSLQSLHSQLPTISGAHASLPVYATQPAATSSLDLERNRNITPMVDLPANSSSIFDIDLFNVEADSNMLFDWPDTPLESIGNHPLNRLSPKSSTQSGAEQDISTAELTRLHRHYFESTYYSFPFLNQDRFVAESKGDDSGIKAIIYAVALAGCAHPSTQQKQSTCYILARKYAEECEVNDDMKNLNFLQALLFIGRFEAMDGKLERSWMTLGRATMVSKLMGLPQMDRPGSSITGNLYDSGSNRPEADQVLLEELRRSFWALYILLSYVKTRTGWPYVLGGTEDFQINLPSPGLLRSDLVPLQMPFLADISTGPALEISSYAGCVLMVDLALCCFDHGQSTATAGFWDGYCALVKRTDDLFEILKQHLNAASIRSDPVAFSLYLNLRATEIFSHESAIARGTAQGLPPLMTCESQRRATAAAFQICTAVRLNLPSPGRVESDVMRLQAIFIAWPLTMALKAFHRELVRDEGLDSVNGVVASSRLLFSALGHIEESNGHWHRSVEHVERKLQEWEEKNSFKSLAYLGLTGKLNELVLGFKADRVGETSVTFL